MGAHADAVANLRKLYDRDLAGHVLVPLVEGPGVCVFQLRRPGTRIMLVELVFTLEGILLHGDFTPEDNRSCGAHMKGLAWFAAEMDAGYLASKFLQREWTAEGAEDHVRNNIATLREQLLERDDDALRARISSLEARANKGDGFTSLFEYTQTWVPEFEADRSDLEWEYPRDDYSTRGVAALGAIHARFRALFWERYDSITSTVAGWTLSRRVAEEGARP